MPANRNELTEIHFAEGDVQDEEHEQRENCVKNGGKEVCSTIQGWNKGKNEIQQGTRNY
ncbi:hypothetical protein JCM17724A_18640 [Prevotella fusca JCM 17724]